MRKILHIINTSQSESQTGFARLEIPAASDALLLIENGVYDALATTANEATMAEVRAKLYVLAPDLDARGFRREDILDYVTPVDYDGFVDLTAQFELSMSW